MVLAHLQLENDNEAYRRRIKARNQNLEAFRNRLKKLAGKAQKLDRSFNS